MEKAYTVSRVIDGDTLVIDNNQQIRLLNVDAPEVGHCGYEEAKHEMEKLTLGKNITIKGDTNDKFGRLLVTAWVGGNKLNEEIIRSGWARYDSQGGNKELKKIDDESEQQGRGIYGKCREIINKSNPNCLIKGNNRESTNDHIYILPGCKGYTSTIIATDMGDRWFCNEEEAISNGYVKAQNCK